MADEESPITHEHLQKLYDDLPDQTPRELPKVQIGGDEYHVDGRLHEIRSVSEPSERVSFDEIDMMNRFAEVVRKDLPEEEVET